MDFIIQCIGAFIGSLGFSFVFRVYKTYKNAIIAACIAALGWAIYLAFSNLNNSMYQTFIAALFVATLSEIMARLRKAPATLFIVISIFPLVPGKFIYLSMLYWIQGDFNAFLNALSTTFLISGAIAFGILIISTIFKVNKTFKEKYKKKLL